ncbi:MAG: DNA-processing protein DprA [Treponema sp.]|nr:DNA-processing protein DprA [Treponema sp.]
MDKRENEALENVKTHTSCNIELLARLIVSDASFLTLREKLIFYDFLLHDGENKPFQSEKDFISYFLTLRIDSISFAVKRVFQRVKWTSKESLEKVLLAKKIMESQKINFTSYSDSDFPPMLREMKDPPFLIFYRGNLQVLNRRCVSVVGTRRAFPKDLSEASQFARDACDDGFCVVSGLAFGIDAAAHKGALLSSNPATCAVLPSGIDMITPRSNIPLASKILSKNSLIISEYLPGTPSMQFRYVQRNRIIAALSSATVVIQASGGSGAMITAELALDYNREVFFHKQCFSKESIAINQFSELQWKNLIAQGKKIEYKMNNTPKSFVEDGAAVISNYQEFKEVLNHGKG